MKKYIVKNRNEKIKSRLETETAGLGAVGNMYLANLTDDGSSARLIALKNEGGKPQVYTYKVNFYGDKTALDLSSETRDDSYDKLVAEMEANDKTLLALSESKDKKDKDAKKKAKNYLKAVSKKPLPTHFESLEEYAAVCMAVKNRIELQKQYLP